MGDRKTVKVKYLILGAGPAGLTIANRLKQRGEDSFLVLEKEEIAGGLCRSTQVDGSAFDIGGGHFLDVRRPEINRFLFRFLPENEWNLFERDSRILVNGNLISHPIEANIWQMKIPDQVAYLKSIASAGCNRDEPVPEKFTDWIYWKLGERIAEDYMIPYNRKVFSRELNQLGTYWLEKLPSVSFEETLLSCLEKKAYATQPGHAWFYYPKRYGYGELWLRMADAVRNSIRYHAEVIGIDFETKKVQLNEGTVSAETVFVTIPWTSFQILRGMPEAIRDSIGKLRYSAVETRYFDRHMDTPAQWIYYPDPKLPYHRILIRENFCEGARGYWTETNAERTVLFDCQSDHSFRYMNEYAYPLNTAEKPDIMSRLLKWAEEKSVIGVGRWGEWQHYNSDATVEAAIQATDRILEKAQGRT